MKILNGSIGLSLFAILLAAVLPTQSAQAAPAAYCAPEGSSCISTSGEMRDAYYGANGQYIHKVVDGTFDCSSNAFGGDPIRGVVKSCYMSAPSYTYRTAEWANVPPIFTPQLFEQTPVIVAYGAAGRYATNVIGQSNCNNASFGWDPAPGYPKSCYTSPKLTQCASEGGTCNVNGVALVAYGWYPYFSYKPVSGPVACNNANFGDPNPGQAKACFVSAQ